MEQRGRFIDDHRLGLYNMTELCARYAISRKTGYKWLARYDAGGRPALQDQSRAAHTCPHKIGAPVEALLVAARRQHGTRIASSSVRKGLGDLYRTSATGTAGDEELFESPINKNVLDWSPDGQFILYAVQDPVTRRDLWALPLTGDRKPMVLVQSAAEETGARFSPDSRWIVYESDETGQPEIFVTSFPRPTGATQISSAGGTRPQWRQDGREIFYSAPDGRLTSVSVTLRPEGRVDLGTPVPLFATQPGARVVATPDGQRFLIDTPAGDARNTLLNVVLNWKPGMR